MMIALLVAAAAFTASLQEYDNPAFKAWSEWKVGAWVKLKVELQGIQKVDTELTSKLVDVGPEKIVIEQAAKATANGRENVLPTEKKEIKPKDPTWGPVEKEGDEEIEAAGRKLRCHWIYITRDAGKGTITAWFSKDVPGGLVKAEMTSGSVRSRVIALDWGKE